jgi:hypothetical protein
MPSLITLDHIALATLVSLITKTKLGLSRFLRDNVSVFAWKPADMPDVPRHLIEHCLNVSKTARPIKQKLRRFAHVKKEAIRAKVTRLLAAGFIKEVYHPDWLANPFIVRKKNNKEECALIILISINTALKTPSAYLA